MSPELCVSFLFGNGNVDHIPNHFRGVEVGNCLHLSDGWTLEMFVSYLAELEQEGLFPYFFFRRFLCNSRTAFSCSMRSSMQGFPSASTHFKEYMSDFV